MLLALALALACAHAPGGASPLPPAGLLSISLPDGTLPRPFTAEQIRAAMPVGTQIDLRVAVGGQAPVSFRWVVSAADAETVTILSSTQGPDGRWTPDEGDGRSRWSELVEHAAFPSKQSQRVESTVDTPLGHFDTWRYTVNGKDEAGNAQVSTYHFARTLPGPPVLYTIEQGGVEVFRMSQTLRR